MGAPKSRGSFHTAGPVPGTVEIESEHEIATPAAVPSMSRPVRSSGICMFERLQSGRYGLGFDEFG